MINKVVVDNHKMHVFKAGEKGPFILLPHSLSGLEAIRWVQRYPKDVKAIIGLDMAIPQTYKEWSLEQVDKRIRFMKRMQRLNRYGLLFWLPVSTRGLNKDEQKKLHRLKRRNAMNNCYIHEAEAVIENAETVFLNCGHYIHYYESDKISRKIKEYVRELN